nr:basic proline-rich protein-like [Aegilops tauschii subsp. strangulata]
MSPRSSACGRLAVPPGDGPRRLAPSRRHSRPALHRLAPPRTSAPRWLCLATPDICPAASPFRTAPAPRLLPAPRAAPPDHRACRPVPVDSDPARLVRRRCRPPTPSVQPARPAPRLPVSAPPHHCAVSGVKRLVQLLLRRCARSDSSRPPSRWFASPDGRLRPPPGRPAACRLHPQPGRPASPAIRTAGSARIAWSSSSRPDLAPPCADPRPGPPRPLPPASPRLCPRGRLRQRLAAGSPRPSASPGRIPAPHGRLAAPPPATPPRAPAGSR